MFHTGYYIDQGDRFATSCTDVATSDPDKRNHVKYTVDDIRAYIRFWLKEEFDVDLYNETYSYSSSKPMLNTRAAKLFKKWAKAGDDRFVVSDEEEDAVKLAYKLYNSYTRLCTHFVCEVADPNTEEDFFYSSAHDADKSLTFMCVGDHYPPKQYLHDKIRVIMELLDLRPTNPSDLGFSPSDIIGRVSSVLVSHATGIIDQIKDGVIAVYSKIQLRRLANQDIIDRLSTLGDISMTQRRKLATAFNTDDDNELKRAIMKSVVHMGLGDTVHHKVAALHRQYVVNNHPSYLYWKAVREEYFTEMRARERAEPSPYWKNASDPRPSKLDLMRGDKVDAIHIAAFRTSDLYMEALEHACESHDLLCFLCEGCASDVSHSVKRIGRTEFMDVFTPSIRALHVVLLSCRVAMENKMSYQSGGTNGSQKLPLLTAIEAFISKLYAVHKLA